MRRMIALALGVAAVAGCGDTTTKPTGDKLPPASEVFDKTEKDMKPLPHQKEKKGSGFG